MAWQYATVEFVRCTVAEMTEDFYREQMANENQRARYDAGEFTLADVISENKRKSHGGILAVDLWVLRLDRDEEVTLSYQAGEYTIESGCILHSDTSHRLIQAAGSQGWEMMAQGLPITEQTGPSYETIPMMRREI